MADTLAAIAAGETLAIALVATAGDATQISNLRASLKRLGPNNTLPTAASPDAAVFTSSYSANLSDGLPGFTLQLSSAQTASLPAGLYATDARFEVAGGVIITEPVIVRVRSPVTGPA